MCYSTRPALFTLLVLAVCLAAGCGDRSTNPNEGPPPSGGGHLWSMRFGDGDVQDSRAVAVDAWGNTIIVGDFNGSVDFGGGALTSAGWDDIFVAKLDPNGAHLWSKRFGDGNRQSAVAVAVDASGNIFVTGCFMGHLDLGAGALVSAGDYDAYFVKFSPDGAHLWSRKAGDAYYQCGTAVAVDAYGNVIFAYDRGGAVAGVYKTYINKYDPSGTAIWLRSYTASDYQYAEGLAVDSSGAVILTGSFAGTASFGCGPLVCAGPVDVYVAKIEPDASCIWSSRFGDTSDQRAKAVAVDATGNVIITGFFYGGVDFGGGALLSAGAGDVFIASFSTDGAHRWSKRFGDGSNQRANAVAVDVSGNSIVAGFYEGSVDFGGGPLMSAGGNDIFLAKFGRAGAHVWSKRFGDGSNQIAHAIAVDASGNVIVTGIFWGTVDFGGGPLTSAGEADIFVAKFKP